MDYERFLVERITQLRDQKMTSSYIMSYDIDRGKNYMKNIESGQNYPSWPMFFCICEYLGVTPAEFFDTEDSAPGETKDYMTVFKHLTGENRKMVLDLAKKLLDGQ